MNLRETRVRKFLSMAKLAKKSKVSLSTVRDIEAGRHTPSLTTCGKLGRALRIRPEMIAECRAAMEKALGAIRRGLRIIPGGQPRELSSDQQQEMSLRKIAQKLGVSHTLLVLWRQGKRKLPPRLSVYFDDCVVFEPSLPDQGFESSCSNPLSKSFRVLDVQDAMLK